MLLVVCFLAQLLTVLWGANKGIDVTDEGYYWLCYEFPGYYYQTSAFHQIISPLLKPMAPGIVIYRLIRPVLGLLSVSVFAWGILRYMETIRAPRDSALFGWFGLWLYLACSFFLGYCHGPQTFSYNNLNDVLILITSGLTMAIVSRLTAEERIPVRLHPGVGCWILCGAGFLREGDYELGATVLHDRVYWDLDDHLS